MHEARTDRLRTAFAVHGIEGGDHRALFLLFHQAYDLRPVRSHRSHQVDPGRPVGDIHADRAYDQLPTALVPKDNEELALTLNGKRKLSGSARNPASAGSKLTRADFETATRSAGLNEHAVLNLFDRMKEALPKWMAFIGLGFVPEEVKERYRALITERTARIGL